MQSQQRRSLWRFNLRKMSNNTCDIPSCAQPTLQLGSPGARHVGTASVPPGSQLTVPTRCLKQGCSAPVSRVGLFRALVRRAWVCDVKLSHVSGRRGRLEAELQGSLVGVLQARSLKSILPLVITRVTRCASNCSGSLQESPGSTHLTRKAQAPQ